MTGQGERETVPPTAIVTGRIRSYCYQSCYQRATRYRRETVCANVTKGTRRVAGAKGWRDVAQAAPVPAIVGHGIVLSRLCPSRKDLLERLSDRAQDCLDIAAHEEKDGDYHDGDEGQDQGVLRETLSFLASETGEMRH